MEELRKITAEELKNILAEHEKWLRTNHKEWLRTNHKEGIRADLRNVDLKNADLSGTNLEDANLAGADLRRANLRGANLFHTNLRRSDLSEADLRMTNLRGADLGGANLGMADLRGANYFIPSVCPEEGSFIAWKKAGSRVHNDCAAPEHYDVITLDVIVKLFIPEDALRSSGTSRKCRASKAVVLDIQSLEGESLKGRIAYSGYETNFVYEIGKTVKPDGFDKNRFNECSQGIHFFIDRQEAVNYLI